MTKRRSFEENYPIRDDYARFDQRDSAFGQAIKKNGKPVEFGSEEYKADRIRKNVPGFSLIDYAFNAAAGMYEFTPGEHVSMDRGFYSWGSLGVARKPEGIPRWEGEPGEAATIIGKAARYFGAVSAGFCELDRRWVYSTSRWGKEIVFEDVDEGYTTEEKAVIPEGHRWVIALTVPMEYEETMYSPTALEVATVMGYSRMHILAGQVAEFIRGLGYHAVPCGNDTALSVPIAIQAGLGHLGRHGRLITWERGPLVRICKVFTDIPLPTSPQAPGGIIEYCQVCKKCAKHCPSRSITEGPRTWEGPCDANNPGVYKWYTDAESCLRYWNEVGTGCNVCFRICSFTKPQGAVHSAVKWFIRNVPQLNGLWAWTDELLGYGRMSEPREYWKE
ncbi:MAG: reductive dehalogenase [Candidatus Bathyarchaeota archaeon]|nr:MAG: reductive dehalogenase [Candidatus Bathyarchaeota archaeon]